MERLLCWLGHLLHVRGTSSRGMLETRTRYLMGVPDLACVARTVGGGRWAVDGGWRIAREWTGPGTGARAWLQGRRKNCTDGKVHEYMTIPR